MKRMDITLENGQVLEQGSKAWVTYMNAFAKKQGAERALRLPKLFKPTAENPTVFMYDEYRDSTFNVRPLLRFLGKHKPDEALQHLDDALSDLTLYYLEEGVPTSAAMNVRILRDLRNALMSGAGIFCFDEHFEKEEEQAA